MSGVFLKGKQSGQESVWKQRYMLLFENVADIHIYSGTTPRKFFIWGRRKGGNLIWYSVQIHRLAHMHAHTRKLLCVNHLALKLSESLQSLPSESSD